jgi:MFS family permease
LACGISIALTPLFLDEHGFGKEEIGTLALFFAGGLVLFAVPVGAILRRFGGKRTLTTALVGYSAAVAAFPFMTSYATIAVIRFFDGMFSIGVWVSSETILLARADRKNKGHLTSLYAIWLASGYVVGPVAATVLAHYMNTQQLFLMAGVIALFSAGYIRSALSNKTEYSGSEKEEREINLAAVAKRDQNAAAVATRKASELAQKKSTPRMGALALLGRIKTSCFAALCYGYFQSSVVLFLPLYLIESKGIPRENTILLPGLFCLGMLLCSNIAGRFGDRAGHLKVVTILSALGTFCVVGFVFVDTYAAMCALVFGAGATFASMSPVALALIGVVVPAAHLSRANAFYNTFYASGMLVGPLISSLIFARFGGPSMLYHLAALWSSFVLFCLVFYQDDPASKRVRGPAGPSVASANS